MSRAHYTPEKEPQMRCLPIFEVAAVPDVFSVTAPGLTRGLALYDQGRGPGSGPGQWAPDGPQASIRLSPQTDIAWPEMALPLRPVRKRIWLAMSSGCTYSLIEV